MLTYVLLVVIVILVFGYARQTYRANKYRAESDFYRLESDENDRRAAYYDQQAEELWGQLQSIRASLNNLRAPKKLKFR